MTQSEINELLNSLAKEKMNPNPEPVQVVGKKIREYDFRMPKKLSKEQIKIISGVYENFGRQFASYFSGILRTYCEITIAAIEEQHYYEYNNALPDMVLTGVIEVSPIEGIMLVDVSNSITYNLIERMMGGGARESSLIPEREFTEIEISLMERIFKQMAVIIKEVWSGLVQVEASLKHIETNARLIQSIPMDEIVVLVIMDVNIGNVKGTINFCIPCMNIEPLIDKLSQNKYSTKRVIDGAQEETVREALVGNIKAAPLEVCAVCGETVLTLKEILNLQVGDVIKFDQDALSEVKININNGETWFLGIPGLKQNKKAIKISKLIRKRGSYNNG